MSGSELFQISIAVSANAILYWSIALAGGIKFVTDPFDYEAG